MSNTGEPSSRPNILYILSDQHSPRVLGCYGDPVVETPSLDALAKRGAVLDNLYCPSPICVPSRMSMLTGLLPFQNDVWVNTDILNSAIPTFLHSLGAAGYTTTLIGRMHSMGLDQLRGYSERLVGDHGPNWPGGGTHERGPLDGAQGPRKLGYGHRMSGAGLSAYEIHDEDVTAAAVAKLHEVGVRRRAGLEVEPFFLSLGYILPHPPFVARAEDFERYRDSIRPPDIDEAGDADNHAFLRWWRTRTGADRVEPSAARRARAAYWGLVHRLDAMIGAVLTALEDQGLADETMIIYSSDHGEHAGEHGMWWKHTMYEESARVPGIVAWPGVIPGGQRSRNVMSSVDLTATVLAAASAEPLRESPGRSILPLLDPSDDDARENWHDIAFSEHCTEDYESGGFGEPGGSLVRMVREDAWKLIYYHGHEPQLFNLEDDPRETVDRAADPACASIREHLTGLVLADWNPDVVAERMAYHQWSARLFSAWRGNVEPEEQYVWPMSRDMNYLTMPSAHGAGR